MSVALGDQPMGKNRRLAKASHVVPSNQIKSLASQLLSLRANSSEHKTIGIAGCFEGTGASTIASNLAVAISSSVAGDILLIDATEPSRGSRANDEPGWIDFVFSDLELSQVVRPTDIAKLFVMGYGQGNNANRGAFNRERLLNVFSALKDRFEFVFIDLPSGSDQSECIPIAETLDGTLLVIRAGHAQSSAAVRFNQELKRHGANVLGAVLNQTESYVPGFLRPVFGLR
jgi:protein-tyrosine kinase